MFLVPTRWAWRTKSGLKSPSPPPFVLLLLLLLFRHLIRNESCLFVFFSGAFESGWNRVQTGKQKCGYVFCVSVWWLNCTFLVCTHTSSSSSSFFLCATQTIFVLWQRKLAFYASSFSIGLSLSLFCFVNKKFKNNNWIPSKTVRSYPGTFPLNRFFMTIKCFANKSITHFSMPSIAKSVN